MSSSLDVIKCLNRLVKGRGFEDVTNCRLVSFFLMFSSCNIFTVTFVLILFFFNIFSWWLSSPWKDFLMNKNSLEVEVYLLCPSLCIVYKDRWSPTRIIYKDRLCFIYPYKSLIFCLCIKKVNSSKIIR